MSLSPHPPSLFSVELRTSRWELLVDWYRDVLGLKVLLRVIDDHYALLDAGGMRLAIIGRTAPGESSGRWSLDTITAAIRGLAAEGCCLIVTTGGTGPAPRDLTPEATELVCTRLLPGFGELMRQESLKHVPTAILSRQTAGICGNALVVNLPGRPRSIRECLDAVFPAIPYCIDLVHTGQASPPRLETNPERLIAFRPKG